MIPRRRNPPMKKGYVPHPKAKPVEPTPEPGTIEAHRVSTKQPKWVHAAARGLRNWPAGHVIDEAQYLAACEAAQAVQLR